MGETLHGGYEHAACHPGEQRWNSVDCLKPTIHAGLVTSIMTSQVRATLGECKRCAMNFARDATLPHTVVNVSVLEKLCARVLVAKRALGTSVAPAAVGAH